MLLKQGPTVEILRNVSQHIAFIVGISSSKGLFLATQSILGKTVGT